MNLKKMLPFLDEESRDDLIEQLLNEELENFSIISLYPFINNVQKTKIMTAIVEKKLDVSLTALLPFLSKSSLDDLIALITAGDYDHINVDMLLPFLDHDQVRKLFKDAVKKQKKQA